MTDVINYWPDPDFKTSTRTAHVGYNMFPNPSPTVNLTNWAAASGGSISRVAGGLFPENTYKCRVVNGVTLTGADTVAQNQNWSFTGKVKAIDAMTITISAAMADASQPIRIDAVGWGSFGWGQELTYTDGASRTLAAGEECLFRIRCGENTPYGTPSGPSHQVNVTLSGTGSFDVDGITQSIGVSDGVGATYSIPDAFLYFSGDTPDDENFTYEWYGTPYASPSLQKAKVPKYAYGNYDYIFSDEMPLVPSQTFSYVKDGETRLAIRSEIQFGGHSAHLFDGTLPAGGDAGTGNSHYREIGLTLPAGKYALTYECIQDYKNAFYGEYEPGWGGGTYAYVYDSTSGGYPPQLAYMPVTDIPPYRKRVTVAFTVTEGMRVLPEIYVGLNWVSGDAYVSNCGIFEIGDILFSNDYLPANAENTWDLTALGTGMVPGTRYHCNVEAENPSSQPIIEYRVGTGSWTTLAEDNTTTTDPDQIYASFFDFTMPADATEVRLRLRGNLSGNGINTFDLFEAPPEYFDGDTPDGGGFTYSWTGTPYDSTSVRSVAAATPTINAQIFVGGVAKTVSEMRAVKGGVLTPVSQIGI